MPEDEFRTDLQWPTDPLGERHDQPGTEADVPSAPRPAIGRAELGELADRILEALATVRADLNTDLDGLRADVAALRQSIDEVLERPPPVPAGKAPPLPSLAPVLEEIAQVRKELASLKRRIGLRAEADADAAVLTDEQLDRIARTVAGLLSRGTERAR